MGRVGRVGEVGVVGVGGALFQRGVGAFEYMGEDVVEDCRDGGLKLKLKLKLRQTGARCEL